MVSVGVWFLGFLDRHMSKTIVPRIRGRAIQEKSHWTWEIFITIGSEDDIEPIYLKSKDQFLNDIAAINNMKGHIPGLMEKVLEALVVKMPSEGFLDLIGHKIISAEELIKPVSFENKKK